MKSLIDYINESRFILLLELLDRSESIKKFHINHTEAIQNTIPVLWYVFKDKKAYLKELKELCMMACPMRSFQRPWPTTGTGSL